MRSETLLVTVTGNNEQTNFTGFLLTLTCCSFRKVFFFEEPAVLTLSNCRLFEDDLWTGCYIPGKKSRKLGRKSNGYCLLWDHNSKMEPSILYTTAHEQPQAFRLIKLFWPPSMFAFSLKKLRFYIEIVFYNKPWLAEKLFLISRFLNPCLVLRCRSRNTCSWPRVCCEALEVCLKCHQFFQPSVCLNHALFP